MVLYPRAMNFADRGENSNQKVKNFCAREYNCLPPETAKSNIRVITVQDRVKEGTAI